MNLQTINRTLSQVWKFPLSLQDTQAVEMPLGSKILSANVQNNVICLWALCNTAARLEIRQFAVLGTGHGAIEGYDKFIGTVFMGPFVWHVFEQEPQR